MCTYTPSFFNKQLLYKQQGFKKLQIEQSDGASPATMCTYTPSFFNKQLLYKQQGFKKLQIEQSDG